MLVSHLNGILPSSPEFLCGARRHHAAADDVFRMGHNKIEALALFARVAEIALIFLQILAKFQLQNFTS